MSSNIRLPPTTEAPRLARRAVEEELGGVLAASVLYDARLLVSELVTNSLYHAHLEADGSIGLSIAVDGISGVARLEVSDPGPGFDRPATESAAPSSLGGRGLHLVQQISTRWGVTRNDETIVWFELPLSGT